MSYEVEQSFRNLVMFYQKELEGIDRGRSSSVFFNHYQRKKLVKIGVLKRDFTDKGLRLKLTTKTKHVLNSYMQQI